MPAAAVAHHPGWEPVGEPSVDADALRAELAAEQGARAAETAAAPQLPAPKTAPTTTEPPAPSGADQKE